MNAIDTGLKRSAHAFEWAVMADGILYTAQLPYLSDGTVGAEGIGAQTELTLSNLERTLQAAGGTLRDVSQVLVFLVNNADFADMNAVYDRFFTPPYPNRATVVVAGLLDPDALIEIVAYAHPKLPDPSDTRTAPASEGQAGQPAE